MGLPAKDLASSSGREKCPLTAAPWPQAATLHHTSLWLGATATSRLWGGEHLGPRALPLRRVGCVLLMFTGMASLPPSKGGPLSPAKLGTASGLGASALVGEGQGSGQDGDQSSLVTGGKVQEPFQRPALVKVF